MATDAELIKEIEESEQLKKLREEISDEISFRAPGLPKFAPMLILMAISIIVQVIIACRKKTSDEKIVGWLRTARTVPRWRVLTLRRRLDNLWQDYCDEQNCDKNVLFDALLDKSENASDAEIAEIMRLATEKDAK